MMPPDNQLDALWSIVEPLARAELHAEALCYAGLATAWRDTSYYASLLDERGVSESSVHHDAELIGIEFDGGGPGVLELVRQSPLGLLCWLDRRLDSPVIGAPHTYGSEVYLGDVIACKIRPEVGAHLDFPAFWATAYLVRRRGDRDKQGRIAQQGLSQHRFTPHWFVMPDTPDPSQRGRKIEIVSAVSTFRYDCQAIQARGRMNIYVAEFPVPPNFASTLTSAGGNTYWTAQGLENEAVIAASAVAHVRRAAGIGADVLVFPELTIPPLVRDAIANELGSSRTGISLVVAGSFHEALAGSGQVRNVCHLLDGFGNSVKVGSASVSRNWTHDKFNPVRIAHPGAQLLQEDLHAGTLITLVNTPIGLHSIMTCLDLAQAAVISAVRLEFLPQQFLWSPSMSESVSAHRDHAKTIHLNHATIIACANQAQADFGNNIAIRGNAMGSFVHGAQSNQTTVPLEFAQFFVVNLQSERTMPSV